MNYWKVLSLILVLSTGMAWGMEEKTRTTRYLTPEEISDVTNWAREIYTKLGKFWPTEEQLPYFRGQNFDSEYISTFPVPATASRRAATRELGDNIVADLNNAGVLILLQLILVKEKLQELIYLLNLPEKQYQEFLKKKSSERKSEITEIEKYRTVSEFSQKSKQMLNTVLEPVRRKMQKKILDLTEMLGEGYAASEQYRIEAESLKKDIEYYSENNAELNKLIDRYYNEIMKKNNELKEKKEELNLTDANARKAIERSDNQIKLLNNHIIKLTGINNELIQDNRELVNSLKNELFEAENASAESQKKSSKIIEELRKEIDLKDQELNQNQEKIQRLFNELEEKQRLQEKLLVAEEKIEALQNSLAEMNRSFDVLVKKRQEKETTKGEKEEETQEEKVQKKLLEEEQRRLVGVQKEAQNLQQIILAGAVTAGPKQEEEFSHIRVNDLYVRLGDAFRTIKPELELAKNEIKAWLADASADKQDDLIKNLKPILGDVNFQGSNLKSSVDDLYYQFGNIINDNYGSSEEDGDQEPDLQEKKRLLARLITFRDNFEQLTSTGIDKEMYPKLWEYLDSNLYRLQPVSRKYQEGYLNLTYHTTGSRLLKAIKALEK